MRRERLEDRRVRTPAAPLLDPAHACPSNERRHQHANGAGLDEHESGRQRQERRRDVSAHESRMDRPDGDQVTAGDAGGLDENERPPA